MISATRTGFPRLFFVNTDNGILVTNMLQLNDYSRANICKTIKVINELNIESVVCKFYIENDILTAETVLFSDIDMDAFCDFLNVVKFDMDTLLRNKKELLKLIS
ncbi:MAG: hypothetical protein K9I36_16850 [Bacteroidia bacterium]|nr:hypothetical protein [Bacteroidia bacterium]